MYSVKLFDSTISLLEEVLNFSSLRHNIIASNIANMSTPGYRVRELLFQRELREALSSGDKLKPVAVSWKGSSARAAASPLKEVRPRLVYEDAFNMASEGNTVDVDQEMRKLAENNLFYDVAIQLMARKMNIIKASIG